MSASDDLVAEIVSGAYLSLGSDLNSAPSDQEYARLISALLERPRAEVDAAIARARTRPDPYRELDRLPAWIASRRLEAAGPAAKVEAIADGAPLPDLDDALLSLLGKRGDAVATRAIDRLFKEAPTQIGWLYIHGRDRLKAVAIQRIAARDTAWFDEGASLGVVGELEALLADPDATVRRCAAAALAKRGHEVALDMHVRECASIPTLVDTVQRARRRDDGRGAAIALAALASLERAAPNTADRWFELRSVAEVGCTEAIPKIVERITEPERFGESFDERSPRTPTWFDSLADCAKHAPVLTADERAQLVAAARLALRYRDSRFVEGATRLAAQLADPELASFLERRSG